MNYLEIKEGDKIVYNKKILLDPLKTFVDSLQTNVDTNNLVITLGVDKLIYKTKPDVYDLNRPLDMPKDFDWNSAYGLYVQGKEFCDEKMYDAAEIKLKAAIEKDHNFLPALVKMAELMCRDIRYSEALAFAKRALSINTYDGGANYYYGVINEKLGNVINAMDGFDLATLSVEYRSAAYTALSSIYLQQKNLDKVLDYSSRATDYNRYNIAALKISSIAYRYKHDREHAEEVLDKILSFDPLNHFAQFEKFLWQPSEENKTNFISHITNEQPAETFFELAIFYYNNGCIDESEKVLELPQVNDLIEYWLAFLQKKQGKSFSELLEKANETSPAFVFPFRPEDEEMFLWAKQQTNNWKPKYYLALLYKSRNRIDESKRLFMDCEDTPEFAPFYAARAAIFSGTKDEQVLKDLEKALDLNKDEWRYTKLLGEYYVDHKMYNEALKLIEPFYKSHSKNYIIGMLYAKTLLLNKRYSECSNLLSAINILPFEGATEGRELYHQAKLMEALEKIKNKKYAEAPSFINDAKSWPENLGAGKPYQENIDERLEDWMSYICYNKQGKTSSAEKALSKITEFTPKVENTVSNFLPVNDIVTAWAMEKLISKSNATQWINNQAKKYPDNKIIQWCKQAYESHNYQANGIDNSTITIIQQLAEME